MGNLVGLKIGRSRRATVVRNASLSRSLSIGGVR
jgi:hypothetical protein